MSEKPLNAKDVTFISSGVSLRGTFLQASGKAHAAVLLISGSGPLDRDSNMPQQKLNIMLDLAKALALSGVSSFRYDKRGIGASEGDYWTASFDDETNDAVTALDTLRSMCPGIPIIVIGHSSGATIAIRLATSAKTDGCVLLAAAAQPGEKVMTWQSKRIAETLPFWQRPLLKSYVIKKQAKLRHTILSSPDDATSLSGKPWNIFWFKQFMAFDPETTLKNMKSPVLAITGQKDIQVDFHDLDIMSKLVTVSFESFSPVNLTHLIREDGRNPSIGGYARQFKMPLSKSVCDKITSWIKEL